MSERKLGAYDRVFVESIVEEVNEIMMEKYGADDTVTLFGVCGKDELPGDIAIWVHVFKTSELKQKMAGG